MKKIALDWKTKIQSFKIGHLRFSHFNFFPSKLVSMFQKLLFLNKESEIIMIAC